MFFQQQYERQTKATLPARIRLSLLTANLHYQLDLCSQRTVADVPPWMVPAPSTKLDLRQGFKKDIEASVHRKSFQSILEGFPDTNVIYTDGSKDEGKVGCAFISDQVIQKFRLHEACSVFTAELHAIIKALEYIWHGESTNILLCTDSLSSISALSTCFPKHHLVQQAHDLLFRLQEVGIKVTFIWVPSHVGIVGNEPADNAAKDAQINGQDITGFPVGDLKQLARSVAMSAWQYEWEAVPLTNKLRGIKGTVRPWKSSLRLCRREQVILTRLRIGHGISTHSYYFRMEEPPVCTCGNPFTVIHFLTECVDTLELRGMLNLTGTLTDLLRDDSRCADRVICFMKATGFYRSF